MRAVRRALADLRRTPGFFAGVLACLAVGMGLTILTFSLTSPLLFKPLPYPDTDRLLDVSMAPPGRPEARGPLTPPLYALLRDRTSAAFEAVGVFDAGRAANLAGDAEGPAERLDGHRISATGLVALGARPRLGHWPTAADEAAGAPPTMLLGYATWQRRFGGRADLVGATVQVDGRPTRILGVMPEGFGLLDRSSDAWFTFGFAPSSPAEETQHVLRGVGRLRPGVSLAQAQAAVRAALDEYARAFPSRDQGWTVELTPWREARFGGLRQPMTIVLVAAGGMLLLLAVNVAVLVGARTASRGWFPEVPGGPGRARVVLAQSLVLAVGGGLMGGAVTWMSLPALLAVIPPVLPRLDEVAFDASSVVFAAALCLATGLVVGMVPAWRAARWPSSLAPPATGGRSWLGRAGAVVFVALVAVQVSIAVVLLAGAGLAVRAFAELGGRDVGIDPSGLLSLDVHLPREPYVTPGVARAGSIEIAEYSPAGPALYDRIHAALRTLPGVARAAGVGTPPFTAAPFVQFWIEPQEHTPDRMAAAQYLTVTEQYIDTMGLRLIRGRDFSASDRLDSPWVVLVNEVLARQHWPAGDPIGQRLSLTFHPDDGEPSREVVGLVADTLPFRGASEVPPLIYLLHRQQSARQRASFEGRRTVMSFVLRESGALGDPIALGEAARARVATVDQASAVTAVRTVESYLNGGQVALLQGAARLAGAVALVALVTVAAGLCALGGYGSPARRRRLTQGLTIGVAVLAGAGLGFGVWRRLGGIIEPFLTNLTVTPSDPLLIGVTAGVLVATAIVAGVFSGRRPTDAGH